MTLDPVVLWLIAGALMLIGVIGLVLPGVPGVIAVFGGMLLAASIDDFTRIGWPTLVVLGVLTGCATVTEAGYFWGDYSASLYRLTKAPSKETEAAHVATLEKMIEEADRRTLRVPPGIHAELGHLKGRQGDQSARDLHFVAEIGLYPESRVFIEKLIATPAKKVN